MANLKATSNARKALDLAWDGQLPVDPVAIANRLVVSKRKHPIRMLGKKTLPFSGEARFDENENAFFCSYNENEVSYRQRFTQAHELGHVILGHVNEGQNPKRDTNFSVRSDDPDEIIANQFAAELLMPEDYVRSSAKNNFSLLKLARIFDVSTTAMHFRLKNLGLL